MCLGGDRNKKVITNNNPYGNGKLRKLQSLSHAECVL